MVVLSKRRLVFARFWPLAKIGQWSKDILMAEQPTKIERDAERVAAAIKARIAADPVLQLTEKQKRQIERRKNSVWRTASEAGLNPRVYGKHTPVWMCKVDDFFTYVFALVALVTFGGLILFGIYYLCLGILLKH
jgi:hypothetical protein